MNLSPMNKLTGRQGFSWRWRLLIHAHHQHILCCPLLQSGEAKEVEEDDEEEKGRNKAVEERKQLHRKVQGQKLFVECGLKKTANNH